MTRTPCIFSSSVTLTFPTTRDGRSLVSPGNGWGRAGPGSHPAPEESPPWIPSLHGVWHVRPWYVPEGSPFQQRVRRQHRDVYNFYYFHVYAIEYTDSRACLACLGHWAVEVSSASTEDEALVSCAALGSVVKISSTQPRVILRRWKLILKLVGWLISMKQILYAFTEDHFLL